MGSHNTVPQGGQSSPRLAIVGGGQLGLLLSQAARKLGISSVIVTPDAGAPALAAADSSIISALDAPNLAERIAELADVVTFEFEAVPPALLNELARMEQSGQLEVRPGVDAFLLLQNKATQKAWLKQHGLPTLPFAAVTRPPEMVEQLIEQFGLPFVQKSQVGGYDGYGVQIIRNRAELDALWDRPSIIEPLLEDPLEIAVVVARSVSGDIITYPPVRMTFDHERNILDAVILPSGCSAEIEERARQLACSIVAKLDTTGIFAVEMFLSKDDEMVVNEISPRVHNSGHLTLESASVSQFEQHVRAVCNLPLAQPVATTPAAVMSNLLYSDDLQFMLGQAPGRTVCNENLCFYWYGKTEARLGRKMGHMTSIANDPEQARKHMNQVKECMRRSVSGAAA
jgi:5-(carboxyamino)imidazole ribonucleotide synthase